MWIKFIRIWGYTLYKYIICLMLISTPGFATELDPPKLLRSPAIEDLAEAYLSFDDKDVSIQVKQQLPELKDSEPNEELDEHGLPKKRKQWKKPTASALIMLILGGIIGKFIFC